MRKKPYTKYFEIKPHYRVLDVGSCIGESTLLFAKKAAKVVSVEPIPHNYELLCKNVKLNRFNNVRCINKAIWSRKRKNLRINIGEWISIHSSFIASNKGCEAEAITLNHLHSRYGPFDYIIIDIEGAELEALENGKKALKKAKIVCVESHPYLRKGINLNNQIVSFLKNYGFSVEIENVGRVTHIYGKK